MEKREKRNKSLPLVTVLMTVYNGMPYLKDAVESICNQEDIIFLLLIINNGSTDGSKEYLSSLHDPRICIEHLEKTISRTDVLNYGLEKVKTPYTAILDADDVAEKYRLVKQVGYLEKNKNISLLGSNVLYIDESGSTFSCEVFPEKHIDLVNRLVIYNQFAHSACVYRTEKAKEVGGYPEQYSYAQDLGLWVSLIKKGAIVASLDTNLTKIRVHQAQVTRDKRTKNRRKEEDIKLTSEIGAIPNISLATRQVAKIRIALLYKQLGNSEEAKKNWLQAIRLSPLLLVMNPLLWRRIIHEVRGLIHKYIQI